MSDRQMLPFENNDEAVAFYRAQHKSRHDYPVEFIAGLIGVAVIFCLGMAAGFTLAHFGLSPL